MKPAPETESNGYQIESERPTKSKVDGMASTIRERRDSRNSTPSQLAWSKSMQTSNQADMSSPIPRRHSHSNNPPHLKECAATAFNTGYVCDKKIDTEPRPHQPRLYLRLSIVESLPTARAPAPVKHPTHALSYISASAPNDYRCALSLRTRRTKRWSSPRRRELLPK